MALLKCRVVHEEFSVRPRPDAKQQTKTGLPLPAAPAL